MAAEIPSNYKFGNLAQVIGQPEQIRAYDERCPTKLKKIMIDICQTRAAVYISGAEVPPVCGLFVSDMSGQTIADEVVVVDYHDIAGRLQFFEPFQYSTSLVGSDGLEEGFRIDISGWQEFRWKIHATNRKSWRCFR
ncbi:hypothetical protein EB232_01155 [Mesorhizobium sp. NZP2077]|nr:hypothetical protein EB232_01155 [Mesorhizobium sp. NZP2077]